MATEDTVKSYNSDEVTIDFAGTTIEAGFADGEFLTIEQDEDDYTDVTGTDGEIAVSRSNKRLCTVMVKLLQTSDANDFLSALRTLALATPGLAGAAPIYVKDRNGRSVHQGRAWVAKPPPVSYDRTAKPREWKLRALFTERVDGGNVRVGVGA